jgi:hypothetical protein
VWTLGFARGPWWLHAGLKTVPTAQHCTHYFMLNHALSLVQLSNFKDHSTPRESTHRNCRARHTRRTWVARKTSAKRAGQHAPHPVIPINSCPRAARLPWLCAGLKAALTARHHTTCDFMLHHARNLVCAHANMCKDGAGQHAPPPVKCLQQL